MAHAGSDTAGEPKPFEARDLECHRALTSLEGGADHARLVVGMSEVLAASDAYRSSLWLVVPRDGAEPRRLTHPAFNATSPALDRDGRRLAFLSQRKTDRKQVHLLDLDGGEARPLTHTEHELEAIAEWSRDGSRLLVTAKVRWAGDLGGDDPEKADPKKDGNRPKVARFLPYKSDGAGIVLGRRSHLFSVDIRNGAMTALVAGDFDVDAGRWSPDGSRLAFLRGRDGQQRHRNDLWLANADGANARQVTRDLASIKHACWSPDGRFIALAAGEEEGDATTLLWLVEFATGEVRRLGDDDFELAAGAGPQWHADSRRLAVPALRHGLQQIAVFDIDADQPPVLMDNGLAHLQSMAHCGDRLGFVLATIRKPDEVHTIGWDGADERRHTAFNLGWMRGKLRPHVAKRRFEVPCDGGTERIDAWLLRPDGEGPFPVLIDLHGGPHSHVLLDFAAHVYWYLLVSRGWMVVAPNAVGSSGYGKAFRERLRGHWGELDLPQLVALVERLQEEGLADERVACCGKSYGGFLSAWAIGHCDTFRAAVVSAPVGNVEAHAGTSDSGYYVTPWMMGGELHRLRARYRHLSPTSYCHKVHTPTLLLQGEDDGRCPLGQTEELFAGLVRCSSVETQMVVYPGGSHAMAKSGKPSHRRDYHQRIVDWLERHANRAD